MKKEGTKCVARTINLANPKTCKAKSIKPKSQRCVVKSKPNCDLASNYRTPRPVAKVYSWKDAQREYQPKLSEACRLGKSYQKPPSFSIGATIFKVAEFSVKSAIVAGLIYWTYTEGLWGNGSETEDLYYRMMSVIFPDRPIQRLPQLKEIKYSVFETYNHMVVKGMDIIVGVPREAYRRLRDFILVRHNDGRTERK